MSKIPVETGKTFTFSKTVAECDVYQFGGITGDLFENHVNEEYMAKTHYKHRIAHGLLGLSYTSCTSTQASRESGMLSVSYGYDRIRFIKAILIGDTITVKYTISEKDEEKMTTRAKIEVTNQKGELCIVAEHILKYFAENSL